MSPIHLSSTMSWRYSIFTRPLKWSGGVIFRTTLNFYRSKSCRVYITEQDVLVLGIFGIPEEISVHFSEWYLFRYAFRHSYFYTTLNGLLQYIPVHFHQRQLYWQLKVIFVFSVKIRLQFGTMHNTMFSLVPLRSCWY